MRLRAAVAMPDKGGRPALVVTEVRAAPDAPDGRRRWHFVVGHVARVQSQTIQGARDAARAVIDSVSSEEACVFVDCGTPQGVALRRAMRQDWPEKLHRPHAYVRTPGDTQGFAYFLEAYADGRVTFRPGLPHRRELDRALVLYRGGGVSSSGATLESEDEALVYATCLSMMFPTHGPDADKLLPPPPPPDDGSLPVVRFAPSGVATRT